MRRCEPDVRESPGGWLAASPADYPYRIGVLGDDRDEARRKFVAALDAWEELHERAARQVGV